MTARPGTVRVIITDAAFVQRPAHEAQHPCGNGPCPVDTGSDVSAYCSYECSAAANSRTVREADRLRPIDRRKAAEPDRSETAELKAYRARWGHL